MNWYEEKIEKGVRGIIKELRDNGINTLCSCGCGDSMYIQCETYDTKADLDTIYNVLNEMQIKDYRAVVFDYIKNGYRDTNIEISFPDNNGEYYDVEK